MLPSEAATSRLRSVVKVAESLLVVAVINLTITRQSAIRQHHQVGCQDGQLSPNQLDLTNVNRNLGRGQPQRMDVVILSGFAVPESEYRMSEPRRGSR